MRVAFYDLTSYRRRPCAWLTALVNRLLVGRLLHCAIILDSNEMLNCGTDGCRYKRFHDYPFVPAEMVKVDRGFVDVTWWACRRPFQYWRSLCWRFGANIDAVNCVTATKAALEIEAPDVRTPGQLLRLLTKECV